MLGREELGVLFISILDIFWKGGWGGGVVGARHVIDVQRIPFHSSLGMRGEGDLEITLDIYVVSQLDTKNK